MKVFPAGNEDVPLDRELVTRAGWFIKLRWIAGMAVLLGSTAAMADGLPVANLYLTGAVILAYNAGLWMANRRLVARPGTATPHWRLFAHVQIALDWCALTVLTTATGGLESPLALFYTFHVILAAMLLPRGQCLVQTSIGVALIAAMAFAGSPDGLLLLPGASLAVARVYGNQLQVLGYTATLAGTLYTCAFLASTIAERLREHERGLLDARNREARQFAEMSLLHELAKSINASLDPDVVLQRVAEQAAAVTNAVACSIRLLTESGELQISASCGLSEEYLGKGRVDLARSTVDRKALLGQAVLVDDVAGNGMFQYPEELAREGIRCVLCAPLIAQERPLGVVRVYGAAPGAFGPEDIRFLQHFASLAATAIGNARTCRAIQDVDRQRSQFMRMVAHELRSPLAAVLGNVRIILQGYTGELPEKASQLLQRAHERGNLLLDLVSDLLVLAAGHGAPAGHRHKPVSLEEVTRQVVSDHVAHAEARSVGLHTETDGPTEILGDREQLIRLAENLVSNAVKYTPDGGQVRIRLRGDDESVTLVVEDTGIGIPQAALDRIFEEFYRAENAKRLTEQGTGLGLAICRRIAEEHRGRIALESQEGRGTRVTLAFPRASVPISSQPPEPPTPAPGALRPRG